MPLEKERSRRRLLRHVVCCPDLLALEPFADELVALEREDDPS